ncbi:uncharacterized protein SCHCODRAFT_02667519 [Schizophyllum commune H4-8]|nr:uncharacterized protein SCHCODRAFT_02667519 [Schizophyllum commune H4-8]KAI5891960.1 hypothetical protein SCHCODRAFT_02667519 [Schizophyllum commune H4-8]
MPVTTLVVGGLVAHFSLMVATVLFTSQAAHEEDRHPRSKKGKQGPRSTSTKGSLSKSTKGSLSKSTKGSLSKSTKGTRSKKGKQGPRSSPYLLINEFGGVGEGHEMVFKGQGAKGEDSKRAANDSKGKDSKGAVKDAKPKLKDSNPKLKDASPNLKDSTPKLKGAVKGAVSKAKEAVGKVKGAKRGSAKDEVAMKNMSGADKEAGSDADKEAGSDAKPIADKDAGTARSNRFARPAPVAQEDARLDAQAWQTPPTSAPAPSAEKTLITTIEPASTTSSDSKSSATETKPAPKPEAEDEEDSDSDDDDSDSDDSDDEDLEMITIPEEEAAAVRFAEENEEPSFERAKDVSFTKRQLQAKNLRPSTRLLRARYNFAHGDEYEEYLQDKAESQALDAELRASVHLPVDEKKRQKRLHNHYESDNITLRMLLIYMLQKNIEESLKSGDGEHKYYSVPA